MNSWINLDAIWRIVVVGLLTGAGLPALFALGLRLLNPAPLPGRPATDRPTAGPLGRTLAGLIFAVVLATIGWGVSGIVNHR
ncbi:hypothetical protein [Kitasatospora sp. CB02891]|uniref:hypothetical protein n=1 Tax=Kitasatospora sp. CB02891 TaxID=2020329 RepID=UPI000C275F4D|nr:hypothetical protein [Kitasatospora sp. CB02891]PJN25659.1 hypothetical protein CG736_14870 [Kitasatospora sp. CB02891]